MRQRKKSKMYELVESWRSSGQSKHKFSKANGIKPHILYYWIKRYDEAHSPSVSSTELDKFIPLVVKPPITKELTIVYPNGVKIELRSPLDTEQLCKLL